MIIKELFVAITDHTNLADDHYGIRSFSLRIRGKNAQYYGEQTVCIVREQKNHEKTLKQGLDESMERMMRFELFLFLALPCLQTPNKSAITFYSFTATNILYSQKVGYYNLDILPL